jgi:hypothetical protein
MNLKSVPTIYEKTPVLRAGDQERVGLLSKACRISAISNSHLTEKRQAPFVSRITKEITRNRPDRISGRLRLWNGKQ